MLHRVILAIITLAFVFGVPNVAIAATTITGSAVASATPTGGNLYLVVRIYNSAHVEIGRNPRTPLPSSTNNTYPFNFTIAASGASTIQAYIVRPDSTNVTDYIIFKGTETAYRAGVTLPMQQARGDEPLPRTSAGTLLLTVGIFAAILAGSVAVWRRQRSRILVRRFA